MKLLGLLVAFSLAVSAYATAEVSSACLKCLCEGSTSSCDKNAGCDNQGFCGPFRISEHYWEEAGSFNNDFETCAKDYSCAEKTVKAYMEKFGKDCDGDGDTDCLDFALIHHKGRNGCPYSDYQSDSLYKYVSSCMQNKEEPKLERHDVGGAGKNIQEGAQELGKSVQEQSQQLHQRAQESSQNVGEKIKGSLMGAKDKVQEQFQGAKENVQDSARQAKEGAQEQAHHLQDNVQEKAKQAKEGAQQQVHNVQDSARQAKERAQGQMHNVQDSAMHAKDRAQDQMHQEKQQMREDPMHHQQQQQSAPLPEMVRQRRRAPRF